MEIKARINKNLKDIRKTMDLYSKKDSKLVCVTKHRSIDVLKALYHSFDSEENIVASDSIWDFGENRVNEFKEKYEELKELNIRWHFIGHLQTNKVKYIVGKAYLIHSIDSLKLAEMVDKVSKNRDVKTNILLQINASFEEQKHGIDPKNYFEILEKVLKLENVEIKGLMCMAKFTENRDEIRKSFDLLNELFEKTNKKFGLNMEYLSMGMSNDYDIALEAGSNMIRIGTKIFE